MICYKCRETMKKTVYNGVLVDYCSECQGMWLDKEELSLAINSEDPDIQQLWKRSQSENAYEDSRIPEDEETCPKCFKGKVRIEFRNGVKLDVCDTCGGMFFDNGELEKCIKYASHGWLVSLSKFIKDLW